MSFFFLTRIPIRSYSSNKIKLTLFTKKECSLCDDAKEIIQETYPDKFIIEG